MHTGQVVSMTPQTTTVRIVSHSACSECHAAGLCGLSEYTEKAIEVPTAPSATYGVGDEVNVVLKATMGLKAVWLAYFLPLVPWRRGALLPGPVAPAGPAPERICFHYPITNKP